MSRASIYSCIILLFIGISPVSILNAQPRPFATYADSLFTAYLDSGFAGSVLVVEKNSVTLKKGYGLANNGKKLPNRPDMLYNVASIGKQFTAYAVLLLEKKGLLSTSDLITKFIGPFNDPRDSATIHHLLLHSSGLFRQGVNLDITTREKFIRSVKDSSMESLPGQQYRYSNAGYSLLAAIVEIVSGQPFERFIYENIFRPLEMENTGYPWELRIDKSLLATGHDSKGQAVAAQTDLWAIRGPGHLVISVEDLFKWIKGIQDKNFLNDEMAAVIFRDHIPGKETYSWNKAKTPRQTRFYHKGGGRADFESQLMWYPDDEVIIFFFINNNNGARAKLFNRIRSRMN